MVDHDDFCSARRDHEGHRKSGGERENGCLGDGVISLGSLHFG
jgi:hypothetical protein